MALVLAFAGGGMIWSQSSARRMKTPFITGRVFATTGSRGHPDAG